MLLQELLDSKIEYEVTKATKTEFSTKAEINGRTIEFMSSIDYIPYGDKQEPKSVATIEFWETKYDPSTETKKTTAKLTGSGAEFQVFSMVFGVHGSIQEMIDRYAPDVIYFTADKDNIMKNDKLILQSMKRSNVYEKFMKKFKNYKVKKTDDGSRHVKFWLERQS